MRYLVAAIGDGADGAGQRAELRQVQRRGVVTDLADHRGPCTSALLVRQLASPFRWRMMSQGAGAVPCSPGQWCVAGGAHIALAVLEVVQPQHVDIGRILHADPVGHILVPGRPGW